MTEKSLQEACHSRRTNYPRNFTVSREAAVAWRNRQIGDCLREGNVDAAQLHYGWLIRDIMTSKPAAEIL